MNASVNYRFTPAKIQETQTVRIIHQRPLNYEKLNTGTGHINTD